jgi:hypothetical protein
VPSQGRHGAAGEQRLEPGDRIFGVVECHFRAAGEAELGRGEATLPEADDGHTFVAKVFHGVT